MHDEDEVGRGFFRTPAGKHIAYAKRHLEGALTLTEAMHDKGRILHLPALHLAGHGLELMLKAAILFNGGTVNTGRGGHDIEQMWRRQEAEPVRIHVRINANIAHSIELEADRYCGVEGIEDAALLAEEYVLALGRLHALAKKYPLRYPMDEAVEAPRAPLLVQALWRTSDDFVKRWDDFRA